MNLSQTNITNGNLIRANGPDGIYIYMYTLYTSNVAAGIDSKGGWWADPFPPPSHWIEKEENDEELKIKVSTQRPIATIEFRPDVYT